MLAGILQIRSPSGSNGGYILKIKPDVKKQPALLQAVKGIDGSDYYTLKYNLSFLCLAFTVGDGNAQVHAEIIVVVLSAGRGLHGYFVLIGKECHQCLGHVSASFIIIQSKGDSFDIGVLRQIACQGKGQGAFL